MLRYVSISFIMITVLIYLKHNILPMILFFILPISDFRSTLFELTILIFGVVACFLFYSLGYFAHRYFIIHRRSLIIFLHALILPAIISKWFSSFEWLQQWSDLFINLIAEPFRLLTFTYQYSDLVGYVVLIFLICIGTMIHTHEARKQQLITKAVEVDSV